MIESEPITEAFDKLFGTLQSKQTGKGVELYSNPMFNPAAIVNSLSGLKENLQQDIPKLINLGQRVIHEGAQKYQEFVAGMKKYLGDKWETFKEQMLKIYHQAKEAYKKSPMGNEIGLVNIDIEPSLAKLSLGAFIEKAKDIARQSFSGQTVVNKTDGSKILIPWQGIKHAFSRGISRDEAAVALKLNKVIEGATHDRTEPDKERRNNIKAVHHYSATIHLSGNVLKVGIVVREHLDGKRYYDHYEIKERPASNISGESDVLQNSHQPIAGNSSTDSMSPESKDVKFALAQDSNIDRIKNGETNYEASQAGYQRLLSKSTAKSARESINSLASDLSADGLSGQEDLRERRERQNRVANAWAIKNNIPVISNEEFTRRWSTTGKIFGGENRVYFKTDPDGSGWAIKANSMLYHKGDMSAFLERLAISSEYFPDTSMQIVGMVKTTTGLKPLLKQPFVVAAEDAFAPSRGIAAELRKRGFVLLDAEGGMWLSPDRNYYVSDIASAETFL